LDGEYPNIRAVLAWAVERGRHRSVFGGSPEPLSPLADVRDEK
jgi:hypothetical protein